MIKLKVAFSDFWKDFDSRNNFLAEALSTQFDWEVSDSPDVLICSLFGENWASYSCPRILFVGENIQSDLSHFDASLTFEPSSKTNYYLPLYRFYGVYRDVFKPRRLSRTALEQKKSIAAVFSNAKQRLRNQVYFRFAKKFGADSGGRAFNTVGGPVPDKAAFVQNYKFSLAFENTSWPGYTTEKLLEAYGYGTVPIYWGDPQVESYFNPRAFLHLRSLKDLGALETKIEQMMDDIDQYQRVYEEPLFPGNREPEFLRAETVGKFLKQAVERGVVRKIKRKVSPFRIYLWERRWKTKQLMWGRQLLNVLFVLYFPFFSAKAWLKKVRMKRHG